MQIVLETFRGLFGVSSGRPVPERFNHNIFQVIYMDSAFEKACKVGCTASGLGESLKRICRSRDYVISIQTCALLANKHCPKQIKWMEFSEIQTQPKNPYILTTNEGLDVLLANPMPLSSPRTSFQVWGFTRERK